MDREEASRLAQKCLPTMQRAGELVSDEKRHAVTGVRTMCRLWGGMGYVYDVSLGAAGAGFVVKKVMPPPPHQRSLGDVRKTTSYQVEANFYQNYAQDLIDTYGLSIPRPYHIETDNDQVTICMSRLQGQPCGSFDGMEETRAVLKFLATLHAATWGAEAADKAVVQGGLQPIGSYWHLDTRPDEHASMRRTGWEGRLRRAARAIDDRLKRDRMQCCIHGDAKDANMLFSSRRSKATAGADEDDVIVSMYDFQYCGKSPPARDLAYFLCVAANDSDDDIHDSHVEFYHGELIRRLDPGQEQPTVSELKESLSLAYCDFARFMCGWGFWGYDLSSRVIAVLDRLDGGHDLGTEDAYEEAVRREYG